MPLFAHSLLPLLLPFAACRRTEAGADQDIRMSSANGHANKAPGEAFGRLPKPQVQELAEAVGNSEMQKVWKQSQELEEVQEVRKQSQALRKEVYQSKMAKGNSFKTSAVWGAIGNEPANDALIATWNNVATIDWKGDVGSQIYSQSFAMFGSALSCVPGLQLVGIAVTVLGGMFGLGGSNENPYNALLEAIYKQTEMQIHGALSQYNHDDKLHTWGGIRDVLKMDKTDTRWEYVLNMIIAEKTRLFNISCISTDEAKCHDFRTNYGGVSALMLELEVTRMMSSVYASLLTQDACENVSKCKDLAEEIPQELASWTNLLYGHFHDWKVHRMQEKWFSNGKWTYDRRRSSSFGTRRREEFKVTPGQDLFLQGTKGPTFTGAHCGPQPRSSRTYDVKYGHRRRQDQVRDGIIRDLDMCRAGWKKTVDDELRNIGEQVNTMLQVALHIVNANKAAYLKKTSYSINCGQPPEKSCESVATQVLAGLAPRRGFKRGCWKHVPSGCTVAAGNDWAIHFNRCSGISEGAGYSAVCTKPVKAVKYHLTKTSSSISCGQPPEWECSSAAAQVLAESDRRPGRGMKTGCWNHVPGGCTLAGDWAVHFNSCSGSGHTYYAVCSGKVQSQPPAASPPSAPAPTPGTQICKGAPVFIKSHRGEYLEDRKGKVGVGGDRGAWQKWEIQPSGDGGLVFIKSHRGEYLEDRNDKVGVRGDRGGWQKWEIQKSGDGGLVFIKSHRGEYLEDRNDKVGVHGARGGWQKWKVTTEDGKLAC